MTQKCVNLSHQLLVFELDDGIVTNESEGVNILGHPSDGKVGVADGVGDCERDDDVEHLEAGQPIGGKALWRNRLVEIGPISFDVLEKRPKRD